MGEKITFRADRDTARILRELTRRRNRTKSAVIRDALRKAWNSKANGPSPASIKGRAAQPSRSSWEIYSELYKKLGPAPRGPKRDRARNVSRLVKQILVAKRRAGTL